MSRIGLDHLPRAGIGCLEAPLYRPLDIGPTREQRHQFLRRKRWIPDQPLTAQAEGQLGGRGDLRCAGEVRIGAATRARTDIAQQNLFGRPAVRPASSAMSSARSPPCRLRVPTARWCHSGRIASIHQGTEAAPIPHEEGRQVQDATIQAAAGQAAQVLGDAQAVALLIATLPVDLAGGIAAAWIMLGGHLSLGAMVGLVTLFGITLRNGLLLLIHTRSLVREEGEAWTPETARRASDCRRF